MFSTGATCQQRNQLFQRKWIRSHEDVSCDTPLLKNAATAAGRSFSTWNPPPRSKSDATAPNRPVWLKDSLTGPRRGPERTRPTRPRSQKSQLWLNTGADKYLQDRPGVLSLAGRTFLSQTPNRKPALQVLVNPKTHWNELRPINQRGLSHKETAVLQAAHYHPV